MLLGIVLAGPAPGILFYTFLPWNGAGKARPPAVRHINPADVAVPPGYCIEPVVTGLTYPTGVVTDEYDRVDAYDLLSLRPSHTRLYRTHSYPPLRGTTVIHTGGCLLSTQAASISTTATRASTPPHA